MVKSDINHLEGCPKKPTEVTERHWFSKDKWYQIKGHRCLACGAKHQGKRKKVDREDI